MVLRLRRTEEKIKVESVLEHGHRQEKGERKEMGERRPLKQGREEIIKIYRQHSASMLPHCGYGGLNKGLEHPRILVSTRHGEGVGILSPQRRLRDNYNDKCRGTERQWEDLKDPTSRADR